ncbi:MAG: SDR family NAD(P)-dependent oxidoreductase [Spirochaetales bacterium]|nr:SDR family NAD(P)-dependent oxidoreductase [Spirochaetales bacterium]
MMEFTGMTVLITGASSEIGMEIARTLGDCGLKVIATCRGKKIDGLKAALGDGVIVSELDFAMPETFEKFENYQIDYLVDIAHSEYESLIGFSQQAEVESYFAQNLVNKIGFLRIVEKSMIKGKFGRLLYISSTAAKRQNPGQSFYAASKLAMEQIYLGIGLEAGRKGLSSLILRPGYIEAGRGRRFTDALGGKVEKQKIVAPAELAASVAFFLSNAARKISGTIITMDAGMSAGKNFYG